MEVSGERKKPPTKEDVVEGFLRCNLRAYVGPMWGQVGPLAGDIRLMFGKFGACWGYLGFYGGLGERKKPPTKEDVVDGFLRCNLKACVRPKWGQVGALVSYIRGKLGPCWGYLGFYGGLGVERKNLQPKKMFYAGLGEERKNLQPKKMLLMFSWVQLEGLRWAYVGPSRGSCGLSWAYVWQTWSMWLAFSVPWRSSLGGGKTLQPKLRIVQV
jgi:hypothetical protein